MLLILPILLLASSPPISREFTKSDSTRLIDMKIAFYPRDRFRRSILFPPLLGTKSNPSFHKAQIKGVDTGKKGRTVRLEA